MLELEDPDFTWCNFSLKFERLAEELDLEGGRIFREGDFFNISSDFRLLHLNEK